MITKFKIFETVFSPIFPKIGDYVLINAVGYSENIRNFIDINIGTITDKYGLHYNVKYEEKLPDYVNKNLLIIIDGKLNIEVTIEKIEYWSDNKEELEVIMNSKKYNL